MKQKNLLEQLKKLPLGWVVTGLLGVLLLVVLILALSRCGKKPGEPSVPGQQVANGKAVVETFAQPYTFTDAQGRTLVSDGSQLTGELTVRSFSLEAGAAESSIPGTMVYEVPKSEAFTFESSEAAVSCAVSTDSYYGSVSGEGITAITIGEDGLSVTGADLYCSLILNVGLGKVRNFYLDCTAAETLTVRVEGTQVLVEGLSGGYVAALSNQDLQTSEDQTGTADGTLTLDLAAADGDLLTCTDAAGTRTLELIWLLE